MSIALAIFQPHTFKQLPSYPRFLSEVSFAGDFFVCPQHAIIQVKMSSLPANTKDVPFVSNTPDDMRCGHATLLSIRKYFEPQTTLTLDDIDRAIRNPKGTGTWRMAGMLWMLKSGYEVQAVELLDYEAFAVRGLAYIEEHFGAEVAAWEAKYFDIPAEQARAVEFAARVVPLERIPEQQDIRDYLDHGYIVQLTVNAKKLRGESGYLGHAVLVIGYDDTGFVLHDPGLPPRPRCYVANEQLEAAWAGDNPKSKSVVAYHR